MSSEGNAAHEALQKWALWFGAYLVISARHACAPFISVIFMITADPEPLTLITKTWKSFLAAVAPPSVSVVMIRVILMSTLAGSSAPAQQRRNV